MSTRTVLKFQVSSTFARHLIRFFEKTGCGSPRPVWKSKMSKNCSNRFGMAAPCMCESFRPLAETFRQLLRDKHISRKWWHVRVPGHVTSGRRMSITLLVNVLATWDSYTNRKNILSPFCEILNTLAISCDILSAFLKKQGVARHAQYGDQKIPQTCINVWNIATLRV